MPGRVAVIDGEVFPDGAGSISVWDRGLLLGDGLFETMRSYRGRVFQLHEHLERLQKGAAELDLVLPRPLDRLERDVKLAVEAAGAADLAVRVVLTRGVLESAGPGLPPPSSPTLIALAEPLSPPPASVYAVGVAAVTLRWDGAALPWLKATSYLRSLAAAREARRRGAHEALWVDQAGLALEGASSNLFARQGGLLVTPPADGRILAGITRDVVLSLAPSLGLRPVERPLPASAITDADEAFLTSSLRELVPLVRIDGAPVGSGSPGPVAGHLRAALRSKAGADGAG